MYNKIILVGNLTRDIELKYTQSSLAIANTAIATSRKYTSNGEKKEEVCFVDITFFGRSAEVANQYLRKGSKILVEGRLNFDQWTDQQSGQKRSKHSVNVDTMQMLDSRADSQSAPVQGGGYTPPAQNGGGYNAPEQGGYTPPVQQQQMPQQSAPQQSYNQGGSSYNNNNQQQSQGYQAPQQNQYGQPQQQRQQGGYNQPAKMPENPLPEIDIDEDEIPF